MCPAGGVRCSILIRSERRRAQVRLSTGGDRLGDVGLQVAAPYDALSGVEIDEHQRPAFDRAQAIDDGARERHHYRAHAKTLKSKWLQIHLCNVTS